MAYKVPTAVREASTFSLGSFVKPGALVDTCDTPLSLDEDSEKPKLRESWQGAVAYKGGMVVDCTRDRVTMQCG